MISAYSMLSGIRRSHGCFHQAPIQRFDSTHKQHKFASFLFDLFLFRPPLFRSNKKKHEKLYHLSLLQSLRVRLIQNGQIDDEAKGESNTKARGQNYSLGKPHAIVRVGAETVESFHLLIVPLMPNETQWKSDHDDFAILGPAFLQFCDRNSLSPVRQYGQRCHSVS